MSKIDKKEHEKMVDEIAELLKGQDGVKFVMTKKEYEEYLKKKEVEEEDNQE